MAGIKSKILSITALFIGLTTTQVYARDSGPSYTCVGEESLCSLFSEEYHSLPKCTQTVISESFSVVIFDKNIARRVAANDKNMSHKDIEALSDPDGTTWIDSNDSRIKTDIYHELGHFYAWEIQIDKSYKFTKAVADDFDDMTEEDYDWNFYLISPAEAYAEMFAEHYQGQEYYNTVHYSPQLLTKSKKIFLKSLCEDK